MEKINVLSWNRSSFCAKLQLFVLENWRRRKEIRSKDRHTSGAGYSALSSTYYGIAGTGIAHFRAALKSILVPVWMPLWCLTWLPLVLWCYYRMLPLSNKVKKLIGYDEMSGAQLDICQSILIRRGMYEEARVCISWGLARCVEMTHTRGLLLIGEAKFYLWKGNPTMARGDLVEIIKIADIVEKIEPQQASRLYRGAAEVAKLLGQEQGEIKYLNEKARTVAEKFGAKDQLLKLRTE